MLGNRKAEIIETVKIRPVNVHQWKKYFSRCCTQTATTYLIPEDNKQENMFIKAEEAIHNTLQSVEQHSKILFNKIMHNRERTQRMEVEYNEHNL